MITATDRIESTVFIAAPVERVWDLITGAEHLGRWFGDAGAEIDLRPGGDLSFSWSDHGTVRGRVETAEPPHRFAYRWLTHADSEDEPVPGNSTLAEFTLTAENDGTRVRVLETGFDVLDTDAAGRRATLISHTEGWTAKLGELATHASKVASR